MRRLRMGAAGLVLLTAGIGLRAADRKGGKEEAGSGIDAAYFDKEVRPQDDLFRHVNGKWLAEATIPPTARSTGPSTSSATSPRPTSAPSSRRPRRRPTTRPAPRPGRSATSSPASWTRPRVDKLGLEADRGRARRGRRDRGQGRADPGPRRTPARRGRRPVRPARRHRRQEVRPLHHLLSARAGIGLPDESYYRDDKFKADPRRLPRPHPQDVRAGRLPDPAEVGRAGHGPGDPAGQGPLGPGQEPRRHPDLQQEGPQGAGRADARLRLDGLVRGDRGRGGRGGRRPPAELLRRRWPRRSTRSRSTSWKTWLAWNVLRSHAPLLSKPFVDENFAFYGKTLTGAQELRPRWKRGRGGGRGGARRGGRQALRRASTSRPPPRPGCRTSSPT